MKNLLLFASLLVGITATAQTDYEKRVGVNTYNPRASLEVRAIVSGQKAQGILFPHISEDDKAKWLKDDAKGLVAGTVIWNTTKVCLDYFDGTNWQCTDGTKTNVHPTPWTPGSSSFTGTAVWGDEAGEVISITKNNCPAGQTGSTITYPANTAQRITYTATSTVSQADADQKAIDLMNSAEKQQERQRLAQEYANEQGSCKPMNTLGSTCVRNESGQLGPWIVSANGRELGRFSVKPTDHDLNNLLAQHDVALSSIVLSYKITKSTTTSGRWVWSARTQGPNNTMGFSPSGSSRSECESNLSAVLGRNPSHTVIQSCTQEWIAGETYTTTTDESVTCTVIN